MKKLLNKQVILFCIMFLSFFIMSFYMDSYTRGLINVQQYGFDVFKYRLLWFGFSISWIAILMFFIFLFKKNKRVLVFNIINVIWLIIFVSQICYTQSLGKFMIVSDLFFAGEGLQYAGNAFTNLNIGMIVVTIICILCSIATIIIDKKMIVKESKKTSKWVYIVLICVALIFRSISFYSLGSAETVETWELNYNVKSIYNEYTNPNNSMFVSGFYEYHFRAVYKYFYNLLTVDQGVLKSGVDDYNTTYAVNYKENDYTGLFKGKNVVYVMLESIDNWILDENTMPTLKSIQNKGMNFTNRYAPVFNGGETLNSEFALNTGLYSIMSKKAIYNVSDLTYNYSLANLLKKENYQVNSLHANTGSFYNRSIFHLQLGYDHHYSAEDMKNASELNPENNYYSDSIMLGDEKLIDLISSEEPFLAFITTYSPHLPYNNDNKVYSDITLPEEYPLYSEEELIYRTLANDTDNGIQNLINIFDKNGILDNTVFVFASDHFVYGYSDLDYVALKKNVNNDRNELQNVPFIIWTPNMQPETIDTICDTADVLPTVLNLLGIKYDPNKYMGTDIFADYHDNYVWFEDGSYIEGKNNNMAKEAILTKINSGIRKNKGILLTNYYGK